MRVLRACLISQRVSGLLGFCFCQVLQVSMTRFGWSLAMSFREFATERRT